MASLVKLLQELKDTDRGCFEQLLSGPYTGHGVSARRSIRSGSSGGGGKLASSLALPLQAR